MKLLTKILIPALMVAALFSACKKDKNDAPAGKTHKVVFKAVASAGVNLTDVAYGYDSQMTTATNLSGTTWTSPEVNTPADAISVGVSIGGHGGTTSTMKVQIYVDGELKKESTASGEILAASVQHFF